MEAKKEKKIKKAPPPISKKEEKRLLEEKRKEELKKKEKKEKKKEREEIKIHIKKEPKEDMVDLEGYYFGQLDGQFKELFRSRMLVQVNG